MTQLTHTPAAGNWRRPAPAEVPTMYFIGVTTASSSIRSTFPDWASELGLGEVRLEGIDLPVHAPPAVYRDVVDWLAGDPLSRGALVTTHKIDLYQACHDMFDEVDPAAALMGETSCLSKRGTPSGVTPRTRSPPGWRSTRSSRMDIGPIPGPTAFCSAPEGPRSPSAGSWPDPNEGRTGRGRSW